MSIWGTFGGFEPLYKVNYAWDPENDVDPKSYLDLADATLQYGGHAIRISIDNGDEGHVCALISHAQVGMLANQLRDWLEKNPDRYPL